MGRIFQSTTSNQTQASSGGRIFGQQQSQPSGGRIFNSGPSFSIPQSSANSTQAISDVGDQGIIEKAVHKFGGTLGTVGRVLNIGTDIQKGATEEILEKTGALKETEGGVFKDVNKGSSNIDLLRRVGKENTKPDSVAGFFLGNYTPTNSVFGNFLREVPVTALGIGLDIALDPLSVVSKAGKVAEATKATGNLIKQGFETLGAHIPAVQKLGQVLGDLFVTRYGQRAEFQTLDRARKIEEQLNEQKVAKLVSPIIERPAAIQQRVAQVIKGGITTDEEIRKLAEPIRQELDRVGETISNINPKLLSPETFQANKGTYFPRLYKRYEFNPEEEIPSFFNKSSTRVPAERFKQRSLTEAEAQAQKDLVREAGYPALKGLSQLETAETRSKFFQQLTELASDVPQEGWLQLPDSKLLGDLGGKFLPKAEYESIQGILRTPGELEQMYGKALSTWKTFKTAYNPATISRNDITNFLVLNPLGGVGPHRLDIYAKTVRELMNEGELYKMAQKEGLELGSQSVAELKNRATRLYEDHPHIFQQFFSKVTDFHKAVVNFYGSQDKFFKLANFIKGVTEDGLKPVEAMKRANFYLVDYSEVPKFVEWLRKSPIGVPFISFTYGVSKPLAKTLLERPDKLAAYFKVLNGIQSLNPEGIPAESLANQEEVLPRWIKEGTYLRLPTRDKTGRGQYVDLQYILPFNTLEESSITPSSPVFTLAASIITGKDTFTGNEIYKDADTKNEKAQKVLTQIYRELAPSLFPGGFSFSKLKSAIEGRPDYQGRVRTILPVLIDVLGGVRITPVDQNQEAIKRANEKERAIRDLQTQLSVILKDKTLFPDEKQKESQEIIEKIKNVSTQKIED